ncbi:MAG: restriction endonuclease subunit S, partial [Rhodospirillaceae bacterium]|nr:restriction endonuclease subunit S [Rhodospirillaceae bacterium]
MIDLNPHHLGTVRRILKEHVPACEIRAFGSRATWTAKDYSDLDLAVVGRGPLDRLRLGRLQEAFEESDLPMRVDVLDWHTISGRFREVIERDYVVLQHGADGQSAAASEWRQTTLGEVVELKRGYDLPHRERRPGHVPVVTSSGITDYHSESKVQGPGVVTGRYGTVGKVFFIPDDFWPHNTTLYVRDFKGNDPQFISYFLRELDFLAYQDKAAVPGLNRNHLHQALFRVPIDIREQRAIADVLGTLDDKIALNRRMNETLEAMARALFQDWFVDFGPTRAKLAGHPPYLPPELLALFPERLVNSELGEIPEGWEVRSLSECINVARGLSYKGSGLSSDGVPMHNLNSIFEGGGYKDDGIKFYSGGYQPRHVTQAGDVIVANTEQGHNRLLIGFAAIVPNRFSDNGLFSHHIYRVR